MYTDAQKQVIRENIIKLYEWCRNGRSLVNRQNRDLYRSITGYDKWHVMARLDNRERYVVHVEDENRNQVWVAECTDDDAGIRDIDYMGFIREVRNITSGV